MLSFLIYQWMENKNKNNNAEKYSLRVVRCDVTFRNISSDHFFESIQRKYSEVFSSCLSTFIRCFLLFVCWSRRRDEKKEITTKIRDNKNPNNPIVSFLAVCNLCLAVYMVTVDDFLVCYVWKHFFFLVVCVYIHLKRPNNRVWVAPNSGRAVNKWALAVTNVILGRQRKRKKHISTVPTADTLPYSHKPVKFFSLILWQLEVAVWFLKLLMFVA